jgi:hypothetical protein
MLLATSSKLYILANPLSHYRTAGNPTSPDSIGPLPSPGSIMQVLPAYLIGVHFIAVALGQYQHGATQPCSELVDAGAQGIEANLRVQTQELEEIKKIANLEKIYPEQFTNAKSDLIRTVKLGMTIRKANQKILPADNPAQPGLAIVSKHTK